MRLQRESRISIIQSIPTADAKHGFQSQAEDAEVDGLAFVESSSSLLRDVCFGDGVVDPVGVVFGCWFFPCPAVVHVDFVGAVFSQSEFGGVVFGYGFGFVRVEASGGFEGCLAWVGAGVDAWFVAVLVA
jgi:hypothetical protein